MPLVGSLSELDAVHLRSASGAEEENLWNEYIERYHPLGYKKPFGYWARYFIESGHASAGLYSAQRRGQGAHGA